MVFETYMPDVKEGCQTIPDSKQIICYICLVQKSTSFYITNLYQTLSTMVVLEASSRSPSHHSPNCHLRQLTHSCPHLLMQSCNLIHWPIDINWYSVMQVLNNRLLATMPKTPMPMTMAYWHVMQQSLCKLLSLTLRHWDTWQPQTAAAVPPFNPQTHYLHPQQLHYTTKQLTTNNTWKIQKKNWQWQLTL